VMSLLREGDDNENGLLVSVFSEYLSTSASPTLSLVSSTLGHLLNDPFQVLFAYRAPSRVFFPFYYTVQMTVCLFFLCVFYIHDFTFYSGSVYVVRLERA
jgi:hypothetical protein